MKTIVLALLTVFTIAAHGDEPPPFFKETYPKGALDAAWTEYKAIYNNDGAVTLKNKQLIALAVSAQIPCEYCVLAHTKNAKAAGASQDEILEALAVAAMVRKWSTVLNGAAYDMDKFKKEIGLTE
jgi:AhpD family alkylhydroperoxidase